MSTAQIRTGPAGFKSGFKPVAVRPRAARTRMVAMSSSNGAQRELGAYRTLLPLLLGLERACVPPPLSASSPGSVSRINFLKDLLLIRKISD